MSLRTSLDYPKAVFGMRSTVRTVFFSVRLARRRHGKRAAKLGFSRSRYAPGGQEAPRGERGRGEDRRGDTFEDDIEEMEAEDMLLDDDDESVVESVHEVF